MKEGVVHLMTIHLFTPLFTRQAADYLTAWDFSRSRVSVLVHTIHSSISTNTQYSPPEETHVKIAATQASQCQERQEKKAGQPSAQK